MIVYTLLVTLLMTAVMAGPFSDEQKQSALSSFGLVDAAQAKQQAEEQLQTSRSRTPCLPLLLPSADPPPSLSLFLSLSLCSSSS